MFDVRKLPIEKKIAFGIVLLLFTVLTVSLLFTTDLNSLVTRYSAETVTNFICKVLFLITFTAIVIRFFTHETPNYLEILPGICVSIGVLGTFIGIYIGLQDMDFIVGQMDVLQNSIMKLLEGLKMAFLTSIVGMLCSILLKLVYELIPAFFHRSTEVTEEDPILLLQQNNDGLETLNQSIFRIEESIATIFASVDGTTFSSQLQEIAVGLDENRTEISENLKDFSEKVVNNSTKEIVDSLNQVVQDFNVLLNEMVGQSFKDLQEAMIKLTQWQENYRQDMHTMRDTQSMLLDHSHKNVGILLNTAKVIREIEENLLSISDTGLVLAQIANKTEEPLSDDQINEPTELED
jgi:hypothetical protein